MRVDLSHTKESVFSDAAASAAQNNFAAMNASRAESETGFRLDIKGIVKGNPFSGTYSKNGQEVNGSKSIQDKLSEGIYSQDVSLQRNYLAVMSNCMSEKDYRELTEQGFKVGDMTAKETVTVIDQIKVKLREAGVEIKGYTDTLDRDTVNAVTGSQTRTAQIENALKEEDLPVTKANCEEIEKALKLADEVSTSIDGSKISDNALKYMISKELEPTLGNLYNALFMGGSVSTQVSLTQDQVKQMQMQIEQILVNNGKEVSKDNIANAIWLIEEGLSVTGESLDLLQEMKSVKLPLDETEIVSSAAKAIAEGKSAQQAMLVRKQRVTTEAQLAMTIEANKRLLLTGDEIDTRSLINQVAVLKDKEAALRSSQKDVFSQNEQPNFNATEINGDPVRFYDEINSRIDSIKSQPAQVIGDICFEDKYTLNDVYEKGSVLAAKYNLAQETYEAVGTKVRTDLGDSIKKAFSNVDDILEDMGYEKTVANQRAIRILGYNNTEITRDNIAAVKEADAKVNAVINALKPANVIKLIREGKNPLVMDLDELENTLNGYVSEDDKDEKYSKFLWKLEKNNAIGEEEKESYIGIYRLFRQVEKSDGAVIGSLVSQGAELNVKNLLSALRSRKSKGNDYVVDDSFGGLTQKLSENSRQIDTQINSAFQSADYYSRATSDLLSVLDPDKMSRMWESSELSLDTSIEGLLDYMNNADFEKPLSENMSSAEDAYISNEANEVRQAAKVQEEVLRTLEQYEQPVTLDNLQAVNKLLYDRGDLFRQLSRMGKAINTKEIIEEFETEDGAKAAIEDLVENSENIIIEAKESADITYDDIEDMRLLSKQLHMLREFSKQENYEVPIELDGELTAVNLKIVHSGGKGEVMATLRSDDYGTLSVKLSMDNGRIGGYMMANGSYGSELLSERKADFIEAVKNEGFDIDENIAVMISRELKSAAQISVNPNKPTSEDTLGSKQAIVSDNGEALKGDNSVAAASEATAEDKLSTTKLYSLAKIFLEVMNK